MGKRIDQKKTWMANKHMKMFLSAVIIREMQIKTTKKCQVASTGMATMKKKEGKEWKLHVFGENMEKSEPMALLLRMWTVQLNSM